jgi:hypothetical protein
LQGFISLPILVLVLLVDAAHQGRSRWQDLINEDEDGLLRRQLNSLADDVDKLAYGQVGGDQILLLIDGGDVALLDLLANNLWQRQATLALGQGLQKKTA